MKTIKDELLELMEDLIASNPISIPEEESTLTYTSEPCLFPLIRYKTNEGRPICLACKPEGDYCIYLEICQEKQDFEKRLARVELCKCLFTNRYMRFKPDDPYYSFVPDEGCPVWRDRVKPLSKEEFKTYFPEKTAENQEEKG
jgi:hypothetical protein